MRSDIGPCAGGPLPFWINSSHSNVEALVKHRLSAKLWVEWFYVIVDTDRIRLIVICLDRIDHSTWAWWMGMFLVIWEGPGHHFICPNFGFFFLSLFSLSNSIIWALIIIKDLIAFSYWACNLYQTVGDKQEKAHMLNLLVGFLLQLFSISITHVTFPLNSSTFFWSHCVLGSYLFLFALYYLKFSLIPTYPKFENVVSFFYLLAFIVSQPDPAMKPGKLQSHKMLALVHFNMKNP